MTARYAEKLGVAAILTLPELYYRPNKVEELVDYVKQVAEAAPNTPILYYHHPKKSFVQLPMPEFVTAATKRIPNFKGIKFTSSNLSEAYSTLRNLKADQDLILASPTVLAGAAILGFKSATAGSFNLFPTQCRDIMSAVAMKHILIARSIQEKVTRAVDAIGQEGRIPKLKAVMKIVSGLDMGPPRLPMKPASKEDVHELEKLFQELGFLN
ncbi:N-acetylneuraminate lyase-like [Hyposmocoma kahamanoa]|uniref:N-acetylneuraminate lyase-like n=1 Tax=Hyposmocoma kahamanoa TaxID=1477025 RepID=UPI000E6D66BD|nr:N-acetylneuraminate lyase-like [Hyposmocoma kahamanoa]